MSRPAAPRPTRPYWLLSVLAVILFSPPVWLSAALLGTALAGHFAVAAWDARARESTRGSLAEPAVVLGCDHDGDTVALSDRQLSAHGLILGASGAGKSTTLLTILIDHVRRGRPVVAIDMKGSPTFARALEAAAAEDGRPLRIWTADGPCRWNPLAHGTPTELKDKLIATERFTEPHYQRAAERYLQTAFQVLAEAAPDRAPTLDEVVALMDPRRMSSALRRTSQPLADRIQDYLAGLTPDQLSAIRGLGTRLAIISESHAGRYLGGPDAVDLRRALAGHEVVLFSLNSGRYGQLASQLGTLAIQDLVAATGTRLDAAGTRRGAADTALIGIDEFSALGADNVIALLARGREAGASVILATQELADLDRAAPGLRDQVLGNTAVKIAHRQDVPRSADTIAQMIGTETVWEQSHQTARRALLGYTDTGRGTRRLLERPIVHPNEIKRLPTGHAVVITKLPSASARTVRVRAPGEDARER